jgi:hypothetical protein
MTEQQLALKDKRKKGNWVMARLILRSLFARCSALCLMFWQFLRCVCSEDKEKLAFRWSLIRINPELMLKAHTNEKLDFCRFPTLRGHLKKQKKKRVGDLSPLHYFGFALDCQR